jgi:hypothetical protein
VQARYTVSMTAKHRKPLMNALLVVVLASVGLSIYVATWGASIYAYERGLTTQRQNGAILTVYRPFYWYMEEKHPGWLWLAKYHDWCLEMGWDY